MSLSDDQLLVVGVTVDLDYFDAIWERAVPGAVFVFDDVRWTRDMQRAWSRLRADPRLTLIVDLHVIGIGVGRREPGEPRHVLPPLRRVFLPNHEASGRVSRSGGPGSPEL